GQARDPASPRGITSGIIRGPQELREHVDDGQDLALVPDVIPRGEAVHAETEEFFREFTGHPVAARQVLGVRDAVVDGALAKDLGQRDLENGAAGRTNDVTDEENVDHGNIGPEDVKEKDTRKV